MDFSSYAPFEGLIKEKYGWFYHRYPLSAIVIDRLIRVHADRRDSLFNHKIKSRPALHWKGAIYRSLLQMRMITNTRERGRIYISTPKFSQAQHGLTKALEGRGWRAIHGYRPLCDPVGELLTGKRIPLEGAGQGAFALPFVYRSMRGRGLEASLNDHRLMLFLEKCAERELAAISRAIRSLNLRAIFAEGDSDLGQGLLCKAAEDVGIPYIVLAHGYIQDPKLISIAPIRASTLLTWTKRQKEELQRALPREQAKRVRYYGYLKDMHSLEHRTHERSILFVLGEIDTLIRDRVALQISRHALGKLKARTDFLRVRPHPRDRSRYSRRAISDLLQVQEEFLSYNSLEDDFLASRIAVGFGSSVLVEAYMAGLQSFQLEGDSPSTCNFEGVERISLQDLEGLKFESLLSVERPDHVVGSSEMIIDELIR